MRVRELLSQLQRLVVKDPKVADLPVEMNAHGYVESMHVDGRGGTLLLNFLPNPTGAQTGRISNEPHVANAPKPAPRCNCDDFCDEPVCPVHGVLNIRALISEASQALRPLAGVADAYDTNDLDVARPEWRRTDGRDLPPDQIELHAGRGGKRLLTLADAFAARDARKKLVTALQKGLLPRGAQPTEERPTRDSAAHSAEMRYR